MNQLVPNLRFSFPNIAASCSGNKKIDPPYPFSKIENGYKKMAENGSLENIPASSIRPKTL